MKRLLILVLSLTVIAVALLAIHSPLRYWSLVLIGRGSGCTPQRAWAIQAEKEELARVKDRILSRSKLLQKEYKGLELYETPYGNFWSPAGSRFILPFNLAEDAAIPTAGVAPGRVQVEPRDGWREMSGGARVETTIGRVDASASVYRGFDGLGPIGLQASIDPASGQVVAQLLEFHPRFTMVGGDFETVSGAWAFRGEVAGFVDRSFVSTGSLTPGVPPLLVPGRSFDAGAGFDRRVGAWRVFGSTVVHRQWANDDPSVARTDVDVVGSVERSFRGDRHVARGFAVINPADAAAFLRGAWTWRIPPRSSSRLTATIARCSSMRLRPGTSGASQPGIGIGTNSLKPPTPAAAKHRRKCHHARRNSRDLRDRRRGFARRRAASR